VHALLAMAPSIDLNHRGRVIHWGVVQLTVANLIVIVVMLLVFVGAILLPFPGRRHK
jgi:hypothetical protein